MSAKFRLSHPLASLKKNRTSNSIFNYFSHRPGNVPGTLSIPQTARSPEITLIGYNRDKHEYLKHLTPSKCADRENN